jgi:hypothetical protein
MFRNPEFAGGTDRYSVRRAMALWIVSAGLFWAVVLTAAHTMLDPKVPDLRRIVEP